MLPLGSVQVVTFVPEATARLFSEWNVASAAVSASTSPRNWIGSGGRITFVSPQQGQSQLLGGSE